MEENKEMNIFTMFKKIGLYGYALLKWMASYIGKMLQLTYRYKVLLAIFFIVAVAYALYQTTGDRKVYRGDMTIAINDGDSFQYAEMINALDQYVKDLDPEGLAKALSISDEIAKEVRFVKPYFQIDMNKDSLSDMVDYNGKYQASDTSNIRLRNGLVISLGMQTTDHYEEMELAIMEYLADNEYLQDLNRARIVSLSEMEKSLRNDLAQIDSLQRIEYFKKSSNGINLKDLQINTDKQMFYFNKVDILKRINTIVTQLDAKQEIASVTSKFQPTKKAVNKKSTAIIQNVAIAYLLFLLIALFLKHKKAIMDYLKEK